MGRHRKSCPIPSCPRDRGRHGETAQVFHPARRTPGCESPSRERAHLHRLDESGHGAVRHGASGQGPIEGGHGRGETNPPLRSPGAGRQAASGVERRGGQVPARTDDRRPVVRASIHTAGGSTAGWETNVVPQLAVGAMRGRVRPTTPSSWAEVTATAARHAATLPVLPSFDPALAPVAPASPRLAPAGYIDLR